MSFKFRVSLNEHINFGLTEVDRKDLSETNSKLTGSISNLRNLKDLSKINVKLKGPGEVYDLYNTILALK